MSCELAQQGACPLSLLDKNRYPQIACWVLGAIGKVWSSNSALTFCNIEYLVHQLQGNGLVWPTKTFGNNANTS